MPFLAWSQAHGAAFRVHVVHVRVVATRQVQRRMEASLAILAQPFHAKVWAIGARWHEKMTKVTHGCNFILCPRHFYLSIYLSIYLPTYLSIYLYYIYIYMCVCLNIYSGVPGSHLFGRNIPGDFTAISCNNHRNLGYCNPRMRNSWTIGFSK